MIDRMSKAVVLAACALVLGVPDSPGADLLATFDTDEDGVISADELREDPLVSGFAMPDVELSGSCGVVGDALSIGIGFHAVRARIAGG